MELLRDRRQIIGRYDSRFVTDRISNEARSEVDPSGTLVGYSFAAGINDYLRTQLNFTTTSPYNLFGEIPAWPAEPLTTISVIGDLGQALAENPRLKLLVTSGYFDLACPMGGVEYELSQMPGRRRLGSRVSIKKYFGGHMMYINPEALTELKKDLANFYGSAASVR